MKGNENCLLKWCRKYMRAPIARVCTLNIYGKLKHLVSLVNYIICVCTASSAVCVCIRVDNLCLQIHIV